ncbi:unnamed protein product [Adineta steineri]|uniref:Transmembrane protein n=2 Tax=Adineta steineri TaxID=433720 RepID=A0A813UZH5_9BILA|nr:unnamed protein product [Adineta steineri]
MINIFVVILLIFIPLTIEDTVLDRYDYDAYGTRLASNDYFVVLAQNDLNRYSVIMTPFGAEYSCNYGYNYIDDFVMNVAAGRHQNSTQMSFVYLRTNSSTGANQILGLFTFPQIDNTNDSAGQCDKRLLNDQGEYDVKVWNNTLSEMSTLQMDLNGKYAYGFLSNGIFIFDIDNKYVQDITWEEILPSIYFEPHALDISETKDRIQIALVVGYYQSDINKVLPVLYLVQLNPPLDMVVITNYTFSTQNIQFIRANFAFTYQFNYVMSISIHDSTQQVLIGIPQSATAYLFSFNSTDLILIKTFNQPARSTSWIDNDGTQAALLLANVPTLPWAQSQVRLIDTTSGTVISAFPNNQQTFDQWADTLPIFIRLATTHDNELMVQATDGTVLLISSADAGYFSRSHDIYSQSYIPEVCPLGTYKSISGPTPCIVCPANTKSSNNELLPTIQCLPCLNDSFCPLGSVNDVNISSITSLSQAYAYLSSSSSTSFDDILIENIFSMQTTPIRCILISPFFWSLITLSISFIILIIMASFYYSPGKKKHFQRLEYIFRQTDLIGNGELWFGGLVSFAVMVLIIFSFWFGSVFLKLYPAETSDDAYFACDSSLRNAQFSSGLQLLTTIKSDDEKPIFDMLDAQNFTLEINFVQTGFTCNDVFAQTNFGSYAVSFSLTNCILQPDNATLTVSISMPYHLMNIQLNLTVFWFGSVFLKLYPAETSDDAYFACDSSLRNAQFSSGLQLLTTIKSDDEQPIFDMLDSQNFTLEINFVQTGFTCNDVFAQTNFGSYAVFFSLTNCILQPDNATLTVSISMPYHLMNIQLNLTGQSYIGGVYICLMGDNSTSNDSLNTVQQLKFCQLFSTDNQTISQNTEISFILTKTINITDPLDYNSASVYSGIWIPTSTYALLSDFLAYNQQGDYIRYLGTQHTLTIIFSETQFYVVNEQQPIVRRNEMIFHGVLFTTTILGLFALGFLVLKLTLITALKWIINRIIQRPPCCRKKIIEEPTENQTIL